MRTLASLAVVVVCTPSLLSCVGMLMSTQGRGRRDTANTSDTADTADPINGTCSLGETADFVGSVPQALRLVDGSRESEGFTRADESMKVLLDVTLGVDQLDEAWFGYDGVCWVSQAGPTDAVDLTIGQQTVSAIGIAHVFTRPSDVVLDLKLTVSGTVLGMEPETVDVHVMRSTTTEEGRITNNAGTEVFRW